MSTTNGTCAAATHLTLDSNSCWRNQGWPGKPYEDRNWLWILLYQHLEGCPDKPRPEASFALHRTLGPLFPVTAEAALHAPHVMELVVSCPKPSSPKSFPFPYMLFRDQWIWG